MGSSTDDLFALMMLYRYMDMGRCNLLGVMIDRMGAANADISYHNFPYAVRHGAEDVGSARRHQRG